MNVTLHKQAIVRALLHATAVGDHQVAHPKAYLHYGLGGPYDDEAETHYQNSTCVATGLYFPDKLSEMQTTCSEYGDLWMGLWLGDEVRFDEARDGLTMFPRWLAEVLNKECQLGIREEDIYD